MQAKLTSTITSDAINLLILTALEDSSPASLASAIMAAMPGSTGAVTLFPTYDALANSNDGANEFVAWNHRS